MVLRELDERAVAAAVDVLLVERRLNHRRAVVEDRRVARAREAGDRLERELELARDRRELVVRVERAVRELIRAIVEHLLGFARAQIGGKLVANLLERAHGGRPDLVELDHVKAEIAAYGVADRAGLHAEQRVLERRVTRRHPAEIAALRFACRRRPIARPRASRSPRPCAPARRSPAAFARAASSSPLSIVTKIWLAWRSSVVWKRSRSSS